jgi:hypothetical protein
MPAAETARLIASLELQDKFSPGLKRADASLAGFEHRTTTSLNKIGTGFGRAGSNLKGFIGSSAGLLGIGLGIGGVAAGISSVLSKTEEFAAATQKFAAVTGLSAENASKWVDVLDKFGISGDTAVKTYSRLLVNAEKYGGSVKDATKFQKDFGVNLVDNKGHLVDANELLKRSADFFNSSATAGEKATAMTKLYGKGWQDLIPLLLKGRKGIEAEFGSALTLSKDELKQMAELLAVQKEWNDTIGDTAVRIGVALIPTLKEVLGGLTTFIEQNKGQIVNFATGLVKGARELGSAIAGLAPIAKGIADAWNSIPADFRKLLLGGLVANKVLKMTIGFDPIDIGRKAATDVLGGIFSRGSPANPMYTKEVGIGGLSQAGAAGGVMNILGKVVIVGLAAEIAAALAKPVQDAASSIHQQFFTGTIFDDFGKQWTHFRETADWPIGQRNAPDWAKLGGGSEPGKAMTPLFRDMRGYTGPEGRGIGWRPDLRPVVKMLDQLHRDFLANQKILATSTDPAAIAAAAAAAAAEVTKGVGSVATTKEIISTLKAQIAATKDPALRRVLVDALHRVERKLPGREWIAEQKAAANKIAKSNESVGQKVKDLRAIQERLIAHGDTAAARIVGALINGVIPAINGIRIVQGTALPGILPSGPGPRRGPNGTPVPATPRDSREGQNRGRTIHVTTNVTNNSVRKAAVIQDRMGPTPADAGAI